MNLKWILDFRNQTGEEPLVAEAAAEIQNYCFNYRDQLLAGIIVAGWDKQKGGQVYQVPLGGMCIRRKYAIGGSGSSYVHGFIREFYREGMSRNETVEFVKKGKLNWMKSIWPSSVQNVETTKQCSRLFFNVP